MSKPILIYFSKDGCSQCKEFDKEWENLKKKQCFLLENKTILEGINNKVIFVKFIHDKEHEIPPCLEPYIESFPTILLINPKSYYTYYDKNGQYSKTWSEKGKMKGMKFNFVLINNKYHHIGISNNAVNIAFWVHKFYDKVLKEYSDENISDYKINTNFYS